MNEPSWGDAGGIFAAVVAMLIALGHGVRWSIGWRDRREASRAAKLEAWHRELDAREKRLGAEQKAYWATVQGELAKLRNEHASLLRAYQLIAAELARKDPGNQALRMADDLLRSAFPVEAGVPGDMLDQVSRIRRSDEQGEQ